MRRYSCFIVGLFLVFCSTSITRAGTCTSGVNTRLAQLSASLSSCKYVDYVSGSDSNSGDDEVHPWKHSPGMTSWTTSTSAPTDACASTCASYKPSGNVGIIFKGGTVWPYTVLPFIGCPGYTPGGGNCSDNWYGTSSSATNGCQGSGCLYWGVDPNWNQGTLVGITITRDLGGCASTPTVTLSGGGASAQATAHAVMVPGTANFFKGFMEYIVIDTAGSGYTFNPTVSISGGTGCNTQTAVADITRAVFDEGGKSGYTWNQISPAAAWNHGPFWLRSNNAIWDSFEVRNVNSSSVTGAANSIISDVGTNTTIANFYTHGLVQSSMAVGGEESIDTLNTNGGHFHEVRDSFTTQGDVVYLGPAMNGSNPITGPTACATNDPCVWGSGGLNMQDGYYHNNHVSWTRWQFRGGANSAGQNFILAYNEAWLNTYSCCGGHVNDMYLTVSNGSTGYNYGNYTHDDVGGSSNQVPQSNGAQWYIFDNLRVSVGGGSPAWGIDTVTGATSASSFFSFYNNTIANINTAASSASGQAQCLNAGSGPFLSALTITVQNNHCINVSSGAFAFAAGITAKTEAGLTGIPNLNAAQVIQTAGTATSQGYVYTNGFQPTAATTDTVTFANGNTAANLSGLCSNALTPLCSDINSKMRPTSGAWQAGAYLQAVSQGPPPAPPTTLSLVVK